MNRPGSWIAATFAAGAMACSPALDWREFSPEGSGIGVSFPCRPNRQSRALTLAGETVQMRMLVCEAGQATYAIGVIDGIAPARASAMLRELRTSAVSNLQGREVRAAPLEIKGMTANDRAQRVSIAGSLPDGKPVHEDAVFFSRGRHVYQAAVIGAQPAPEAVQIFFDGLKFSR